jgi:polysaccharide deacetylase family protein (PEP-CTERM system associated)
MMQSIPEQVFTIDLEDWFHGIVTDRDVWKTLERRAPYAADRLLELLDRYRSKATFFALGDVARHHPELIKRIAGEGHEIGSHGMNHGFVYDLTPDQFRRDIRQSVSIIQDLTGKKCRSYRAPYFSITDRSMWALEILKDEGITCDSSIFPVRNPRYGIPSAPRLPYQIIPGLWEWPISTLPTPFGNFPFAGGVYFRFLPWRIVHMALRRLRRRGEPSIFYLHPWEVDPDPPRIKVRPRFLQFRHYFGLRSTPCKLEELLKRETFTTLAQGISTITSKPVKSA